MNATAAALKRYKYFIALLAVNAAILPVYPEIGGDSLRISGANALEMLTIIPPIFILLGLLDVWVERETMIKFMGGGSGIRGGVIAFALGSAAAGPLYAAFPIAAMFVQKGASWTNVLLFLGAWSTTKLPLLLFEAANLGFDFMAIRFVFNIMGIIVISIILGKTTRCRAGKME